MNTFNSLFLFAFSFFPRDICDFEMVKVIAATVASDPEKYSEAFLGKTNEEYCAWILNPEKWGGQH